MPSPLGALEIGCSEKGIHLVSFYGDDEPEAALPHPLVNHCREQLSAYFEGRLRQFDVPLDPSGTEFQHKVWKLLANIDYGNSRSYLELAQELGDVKAIRAVGTANGRNPIAIIVPCHRVIGQDGSLTGYAGGLWRKEWLLRHEGHPNYAHPQLDLFA